MCIRDRGKILGKDGENFTVSAGGEVLSAPRLVIATGSSAAVPPIPGVKEGLASGFVMTNREILAPVSYTHLDVYKRQAEGHHVGIVVLAGEAGGHGVIEQRTADALDLVGRDRCV